MLTDDQLARIALEHGFGPAMLAGGGCAVAGKPERFLPMLRAIEKASRRAALEEAKKLCGAEAERQWGRYKGDGPERGDRYIEGCADGAERCETLIDRALATNDAARTGEST